MQLVGLILWYVLWAYLAVLMVRAVLSFIPLFVRDWQPRGVMLVIAEFVYTLTDPPLRFMGRIIPPAHRFDQFRSGLSGAVSRPVVRAANDPLHLRLTGRFCFVAGFGMALPNRLA